jgi:hypothetical protein
MDSSKEAGVRTRITAVRVLIVVVGVLVAGVVAVTLGIGFVCWSIWKFQDDARAQNVDAAEESFTDNRDGYESAAAYIAQLAESEPDAVRIGWTISLVCATDESAEEMCRDTTSDEEAAQRSAPGATLVVWYAKDQGRVLFAFKDDEADTTFLMFDPEARDAKNFAKERGFTWERDLGDGWSIPGSIRDSDKFDAP